MCNSFLQELYQFTFPPAEYETVSYFCETVSQLNMIIFYLFLAGGLPSQTVNSWQQH